MLNVALNLRRIRKSKGLSQVELASALKISRTAVVLMEQGKRNVRAQEIEAIASLFGCSTASLFNDPGPQSQPGDEHDLLAEIGQTLPDAAREALPDEAILRTLRIAASLTNFEARMGLDGGSLGPHPYNLSPPGTAWEAAHQGIRAAAEERHRLNLGDAPIRDVDETLASNGIRMAKCDLPADISGLFLNSPKTGLLLIVNRTIPVERRRFQFAHGYAHVLFDRNHGCLCCCQENRDDFREIRAVAFAIRFLVPESGVRRYLSTLGKETLGRGAGSEVQLYSEPYDSHLDERRVCLPVRGRRGAEPISYCDLVRIAWFYGVTPSMAAGVLRNLRYLTKEQLEQMDRTNETSFVASLKHALGLLDHYVEEGRESLCSRLLGLSIESLNRGLITHDEFDEATALVVLGEDQRQALLSQVTIKMQNEEKEQ